MTAAIRRPAVFRRIGVRSAREVSFTIRSESLVYYLPLIRSGWDEMNSAQLLLPVRPPPRAFLRGDGSIRPMTEHWEMVAYGDGQPVRRVEMRRQFGHMEHAFEQGSYLFLRGRPSSGDRLLDPAGRVFRDGQPPAQRGGHSDSLRPSEFEHALHVRAEKGRFERRLVGRVGVDQLTDAFEIRAGAYDTDRRSGGRSMSPSTTRLDTRAFPSSSDDAVARPVRARVDSQNDFAVHRMISLCRLRLLLRFAEPFAELGQLLLQLADLVAQVGEVAENGTRTVVLDARHGGASHVGFSFGNAVRYARFRGDLDPVADGQMPGDADLPSEHAVRAATLDDPATPTCEAATVFSPDGRDDGRSESGSSSSTPRRMTVEPIVARSMQVLAPISTSLSRRDVADLRNLVIRTLVVRSEAESAPAPITDPAWIVTLSPISHCWYS